MKKCFAVSVAMLAFSCSLSKTIPEKAQNDSNQLEAISPKPAMVAEPIDEEEQVVEKVNCSKGKDNRRLYVLSERKGCILRYEKHAESRVIATAVHGVKFCKEKLRQVRQRLENSSFMCEQARYP